MRRFLELHSLAAFDACGVSSLVPSFWDPEDVVGLIINGPEMYEYVHYVMISMFIQRFLGSQTWIKYQ